MKTDAKIFPYPESFPNATEEKFLKLILASDADFPAAWNVWSAETIIDDVDAATAGLFPLLSMRLRALHIEGPDLDRIHGVYKFAWFKNQQLLAAVQGVVATLRKQGIPVAVLKGIPLLLSVYEDVGARTLGDGDILIRAEDALHVFALLRSLGWEHEDPSVVSVKKFGLDAVMHATTLLNAAGIQLEVHWHIYHVDRSTNALHFLLLRDTKPSSLNEYLWRHAVPITIKDAPCSVLSSEDLFVHVVVHGAEGGSRRPLRWVADAMWILRKNTLDWEHVLESIVRGAHVFEMQVAVRYLAERWDVEFPESFRAGLARQPVSRRVIRRYYQLAGNHYAALGNFPILWYRYWKYESEGTMWARARAFPEYLRVAWRIPQEETIFSFARKKYTERIARSVAAVKRLPFVQRLGKK